MTMAQVWSVIGLLATAFAGMIALVFRAMAAQRREHTAEIKGTHEKIDGAFAVLCEKIDGLRNETVARFLRFEGLPEKVDRLDRDVQALTIKVLGGEPPKR